MADHKKETLAALKWSFLGKVSVLILTFIGGVILARLLSPKEYGLLAMANIFLGLANTLKDFGFSSAIINRDRLNQKILSTVFWFTLFFQIVLSAIIFSSKNVIADFYGQNALIEIIPYLALIFFLSSFNVISLTLLRKRLEFNKISTVDFISQLIGLTIGIYFAFYGYGIYSLIIQSFTATIVQLIGMIYCAKWTPSFYFNFNKLKLLWGFSGPLTFSNILDYFVRNFDSLIIGKTLGEVQLGSYNKAYSLMLLPITQISSIITQVMFPAFSKIKLDVVEIKRIYLKMSKAISFISFPVMMLLSILSEEIVLGLYGEQWAGAIMPLKILAFVGANQSIGTLNSNIYLSQGRTNLQFKIMLIRHPVVIASIFVGSYWGIMGVVWSYTISTFLTGLFNRYYMGTLIDLSLKEFYLNLVENFITSLICGVLVLFIKAYLNINVVMLTVINCIVFFGCYASISFYRKNETMLYFLTKIQPSLKLKNE